MSASTVSWFRRNGRSEVTHKSGKRAVAVVASGARSGSARLGDTTGRLGGNRGQAGDIDVTGNTERHLPPDTALCHTRPAVSGTADQHGNRNSAGAGKLGRNQGHR